MAEETQNINKLVTKENLAEFATGIGTKHKQYVDEKTYESLINKPIEFFPIKENIVENNTSINCIDVFDLESGKMYTVDMLNYPYSCLYMYNDDGTRNNFILTIPMLCSYGSRIYVKTKTNSSIRLFYLYAYGTQDIRIDKNEDNNFTVSKSNVLRRWYDIINNTDEFTPSNDYNLVHKKYVDDSIKGVVFTSPFISTDWVLNPDTTFYELSVNHNLNSSNLSVFSRNTVDNYDMFVDYEIVDENNIKIISDEACDCSVKIHAY